MSNVSAVAPVVVVAIAAHLAQLAAAGPEEVVQSLQADGCRHLWPGPLKLSPLALLVQGVSPRQPTPQEAM